MRSHMCGGDVLTQYVSTLQMMKRASQVATKFSGTGRLQFSFDVADNIHQ